MATYAVGDVQGCAGALRRLLVAFDFDPKHDRVWFVGDLVNRGPDSLATLRLVKELGNAAISVLGNHDFHLLAVASGYAKQHRSDTLAAVLVAPDREELLATPDQQVPLLVGGLTAAIVGYGAIVWLMRYLSGHSTMVFVVYRLLLGSAIVLMLLTKVITSQP